MVTSQTSGSPLHAPKPAPLSFRTKFWFGIGQAAEGMKNGAFNVFLLLFYSQVMGLSQSLSGLALLLSLLFDAVTDPPVGSLSDRLHSRLGRRHPFMYAAAIPLGISFYFAFSPPAGLGQGALFSWMLVWTVLARGAMTLYYVPHLALGAELSEDYAERSIIVAYRTFFGYGGAAVLFIVARGFLMRPSEAYPEGQLNPDAYPAMGLVFGIAMAVVVFASALGTHDRIPSLPTPTGDSAFSLRGAIAELREALRNRSFRALFFSLLFFYVARGVDTALALYLGTYLWELGSDALRVPIFGLAGILVGTVLFARLATDLEKRRMFMTGFIGFSTLSVAAPMAKVLGLFPAADSGIYKPLIFAVAFMAALFAAASAVSGGSMLADIADEHELSTGRRQEGIFFGALSLSAKASTGLGSGLGALALSVISFPKQAKPEDVPDEVVTQLALLYGPGTMAFLFMAVIAIAAYRLTRERHGEILRMLHRQRSVRRLDPASPEVPASSAGDAH